ncbi:MAG: Na/Pi cotransporter family protein [Mycoplasmatales bacterium]
MNEFFTQENVFYLVGGLGVFLFGIKLMGDALKAIAGDGLRELINRFTSNKYMAVLVGIGATVVIQSSSGTSALAISLVRAGLMSLGQAIGVIMGANIGTTVTAFLLGISVKNYALPIIFVGAIIYMFAQKRKTSLLGQIIFGFGLLFHGMVLMEDPLMVLSKTEEFANTMATVATNPLLGVFIGTVLTMIVQSSSATIGILQVLYMTGSVTFPIAFAILLGDNIGTTITSLLASVGGSRDSRRAALSHVAFNVFGTIVFFIVMYGLQGIHLMDQIMHKISPNNLELQIAYSHLFFNVTVTLILIWFIEQLEMFVRFIVPRGKNEVVVSINEQFLDETLVHKAPSLAIAQGENALLEMFRITNNMGQHLHNYLETKDKNNVTHIEQFEIGVNSIDKRLKVFFRDIAAEEIGAEDAQKLNGLMYTTNDIERIADLIENVAHKLVELQEINEFITGKAQKELKNMVQVVNEILDSMILMVEKHDQNISPFIMKLEKTLDRLERKYYLAHLDRIKENKYSHKYTISYVDILGDLERIGDHAQNVCEYFTNENEVLSELESEINLAEIIQESKI